MIDVFLARLQQGHRTIAYPAKEPTLPDRMRGLPVVDQSRCPEACRECVDACPTGAISFADGGANPSDGSPGGSSGSSSGRKGLRLDLGRCLFCTDCIEACPQDAIRYTQEYRLATSAREHLVLEGQMLERAKAIDEKSRRIFGRSLKLRQVSAGGCNACEADLNVLSTVVFDLGRFGIQFVASPRHADGVVITGPVSENMRTALLDTFSAVPAPKFVIAVGACAISGGPFVDNPEVHNGCGAIVPIDLFIPGCPPHPMTILDGLLRMLGVVSDAA